MSMLYLFYIMITSCLFLILFPAFWVYTRITGQYAQHIGERLGFLPASVVQGLSSSKRIWIHAVSLGEVKVAASIIDAIRPMIPGCSIMLSTTTEHGRRLAEESFGHDIPVFYAPLDFVGSVRKALSIARPQIMVFLETEIWPAWLLETRRMGIKTALINGRISPRSIGNYLKLHPFFSEVLDNFDVLSMITDEDAVRIKAMGADPERIHTNGNAKYDLLANLADKKIEVQMRQTLNIHPSQKVLVAGSIRGGEEIMVIDAYRKILRQFPDTILIIAPRHIERSSVIASLLEKYGLRYQLRSDINKDKSVRSEQVVIINTFGELFKVYSIGTIVFCGASLVPLGGQNPFEPAVWGKTVFYGPSMEDFLDAKNVLEAEGAGVPVSNAETLAEKVVWFFQHPEELEMYGQRARKAVLAHQGAAKKHASLIKCLLD
ncbi:MAG: 3-deoxy-D-manno-octulosonic acid transferase [Thermodesulfobacteriota bacterium]|nr:3-deoxy-D-manno-octulosonic acid transferase [Thermodesulfobacteriota bacterium]